MSAKSMATPGLAARAGRWSAQHRKKAIWGWLAFALIAFMIGSTLGTKTQTTAQSGAGESGRAARTVDAAFPKHQVEEVPVQSNSATATDRSFRAVVGDVQRHLSAVPYAKAFESPYISQATLDRSPLTGTLPCFASRSPVTTRRPPPGWVRR
jgi:hypothetical protein